MILSENKAKRWSFSATQDRVKYSIAILDRDRIMAVRKSMAKNKKTLAVKIKTIADEISEDWLQRNSRPKAFAKAHNYAQDDVIEILHWCGKEIIAEILGSQPYTVSLRLSQTKISADCTCPARHDWPGLCKHIVGLGLYVIDMRGAKDDFPRLKEKIGVALNKLPPAKLNALCLDLAMLNRNFRDRILEELGIVFESRWGDEF